MLSWKAVCGTAFGVALVGVVVAQTKPEQIRIRIEAMKGARALGKAALLYASDNDQTFPYVKSTASLYGAMLPYLRNISAVRNPRSPLRYVFNMNLAGVNIADVAKKDVVPLIYDSGFYSDGTRVLMMLDGTLASSSKAAWPSMSKGLSTKFVRRKGMKPLPKDYLLERIPKSVGGKAGG